MRKLILKDRNLIALGLTLCFLLSGTTNFAQNKGKILGLPEAFKAPKDYFDSDLEVKKNLYANTNNNDKDISWYVYSDRDNNKVYDKGSDSAIEVGTINFREIFAVTDVSPTWIEIAKVDGCEGTKCNNVEKIGWIKKENMLLWSNGLRDKNTKIHKKGIILNKVENVGKIIGSINVNGESYLTADFYSSPHGSKKEASGKLYNFYFILKKEGDRYLICKDENIGMWELDKNLVGWVDRDNITQWNTRICLEPNYDIKAYEERLKHPEFRIKGLVNPLAVSKLMKGNSSREDIVWELDPVVVPNIEMATSDTTRFNGNVMRFPMLNKRTTDDGFVYYRSGVIGSTLLGGKNDKGTLVYDEEISEIKMSKIKDKVTDMEATCNNVNLFFVIEGSDNMLNSKAAIINAINSLDKNSNVKKAKNVKYGAIIYKDLKEEENIYKIQKLTSSLSTVTKFIGENNFENVREKDDWTAMYYGIKEGAMQAGFKKDELNIMIVLGSGGDQTAANRSGYEDHFSYINTSEERNNLKESLISSNIHLHSIQLYNIEGEEGIRFASQTKSLILTLAKNTYNRLNESDHSAMFKEYDDSWTLDYPDIENPLGKRKVELVGTRPGIVILPDPNNTLSDSEVKESLNSVIDGTLSYEYALKNSFIKVFWDEEPLELENFSEEQGISHPAFAAGMRLYIDDMVESLGLSEEEMQKALKKKLNLYKEVYIPDHYQGATYPSTAFTLFMPKSDLMDYINDIDNFVQKINIDASEDNVRKALEDLYTNIVHSFAGEQFTDQKIANMRRSDVFELMQGVEGEGYDFPDELDGTIGEFSEKNKVPYAVVEQHIKKFLKVKEELHNVKSNKYPYKEFIMETPNGYKYYWLRMDQVF